MPPFRQAYDSVLVISDTHVGLPEREIFGRDFEGFTDFLGYTPVLNVSSETENFQFELPKCIILLGDFLDLWDGKIPNFPKFVLDFARIFAEKADVFYLRGNHDYIIPDIPPKGIQDMHTLEICESKLLEVAGAPCFFIHGHQFMSAFGTLSLKVESFFNPYYCLMENFFSRSRRAQQNGGTQGRGANVLKLLTVFDVVVGLAFLFGQRVLPTLPGQVISALWVLFWLLFPLAFVTAWRLGQKALWKGISLILGEAIKGIRGAVRGDTIAYLTAPSMPISRWFEQNKEGAEEARKAGFVCFGHTHIPEGPLAGTDLKDIDERLRGITFLNTGSWMHPPSSQQAGYAHKARSYTSWFDKWDEYVAFPFSLIFIGLASLSYLGVERFPLPILLPAVILSVAEILVAFGKSSYGRLPGRGLRSLAFIGKDANGIRRSVLLYWDPRSMKLSTTPVAT